MTETTWIPVNEVRERIGLPEEAVRDFQRGLEIDVDLKKTGRVWLWSERAYAALAASLGQKVSEAISHEKNAPAPSGEAQQAEKRIWSVFMLPTNRKVVLAAEKGARPRDLRQAVRIRVPDNRRYRLGTELEAVHLHDDLWDLVREVPIPRDSIRPNAS